MIVAQASKDQSAAFQTLHKDLPVQQDSGFEIEDTAGEKSTVAIAVNSQENSDTEKHTDLLESLTQEFISSERKSPAIATKIADLVDSILSRKLSPETVKERVEKYSPPENCHPYINTAKSAISAITVPKNSHTIGNHPLISRFMRGVFKSRAPVPRNDSTWDVQPMLSHLSSFALPEDLDLKSLTLKLVALVALISAQRLQSIHLLNL